jgi:hypothetical protein
MRHLGPYEVAVDAALRVAVNQTCVLRRVARSRGWSRMIADYRSSQGKELPRSYVQIIYAART